LSSSSNRAKTKWNAAHYKQQKFSIDPEIAAAFKAVCEKAGVYMAGEVSRFMSEYASIKPKQKRPPAELDLSTRRKRRNAVSEMALQMERILYAEMSSHDNVPENFRSSFAYEEDGERISAMEDVLELLGSVY